MEPSDRLYGNPYNSYGLPLGEDGYQEEPSFGEEREVGFRQMSTRPTWQMPSAIDVNPQFVPPRSIVQLEPARNRDQTTPVPIDSDSFFADFMEPIHEGVSFLKRAVEKTCHVGMAIGKFMIGEGILSCTAEIGTHILRSWPPAHVIVGLPLMGVCARIGYDLAEITAKKIGCDAQYGDSEEDREFKLLITRSLLVVGVACPILFGFVGGQSR